MALRRAGFIRELGHGDGTPDEPSIHDRLPPEWDARRVEIAAYLEGGALFAVAPGPTVDIFDHHRKIGTLALLTDGEWLWPSDLAYYVEKYGVAVPVAFLEHMTRCGWTPRAVPHDEIVRLSREHWGR